MPGFPRPGYPYSKFFWNNSVLEPSNSCFMVNRYSLLGSSKNYSKYFWNIFACPESLPNFGICRYGSKIHHFFWNTVNFRHWDELIGYSSGTREYPVLTVSTGQETTEKKKQMRRSGPLPNIYAFDCSLWTQ